jgi:hypothetical protein
MARESQEYDQHWENGNTQLTLHHVVDYYHRQMLEIPSGGELAGSLVFIVPKPLPVRVSDTVMATCPKS